MYIVFLAILLYIKTEPILSDTPEYHRFLLKDLIASFTYKEMFVCFFNISLTSSSIVTRILATPFNFGRRGMLLLSRILYIVCSDFIPVRLIISFISNSCLYRATTCSSCSIVSIRPLAMITLFLLINILAGYIVSLIITIQIYDIVI